MLLTRVKYCKIPYNLNPVKEVPMVEKLKPDRGGNITREEGQLSQHIYPSSIIFSFVIYNIVCASSIFPVALLLLFFNVVVLFWLLFYSTLLVVVKMCSLLSILLQH